MKDSCNSQNKCSRWFCPTFVTLVAGMIMVLAGANKFLWGQQVMAGLGGTFLWFFWIEHVGAALVFWYLAATIELVWGMLFAIGCKKTSKYAALGLAVVMLVAIISHLTDLKPIDATGFKWFSGVISQIRLPLLLFAIFAQKATKLFCCCNPSVCCGSWKCGDKK